MPKHYGLKAQPIEIVKDDRALYLAKLKARRGWAWFKWSVARLLRLRWR